MNPNTQPNTSIAAHVDAQDFIDAILEGGPADMPAGLRAQRVQFHAEKIKVAYYGGHEHFERAPDSDADTAGSPAVFRWIGRTRMAE
jgi:hypothetical protein